MQIVTGQPVDAFRGAGLRIGDHTLPLMVQDYIGAINVYLTLPFTATLGATPLAVRLPPILLGLLTLLLLYRLLSRLATPMTGALAALLLAVQPSFVFWMRQGVYVTNVTLVLGLGMLLAGIAWARHGGRGRAFLVGLLAGLGIYAKLVFLWILGGALGAVLLLNLPNLRDVARRQTPAHQRRLDLWPRTFTLADLLTALAGGLLGLSPLLIYNVQTGGTLAALGENLTTSYYGVNNLNILPNLVARWDQFRAVLAGREHLWYLGGSTGNPLSDWALYAAALLLLLTALLRPTPGQVAGLSPTRPATAGDGASTCTRRQALFLPLTLGLALLQSPFTVSGIFPTHFAVLIWLPAAIVALAAHHLARLLASPLSPPWPTRLLAMRIKSRAGKRGRRNISTQSRDLSRILQPWRKLPLQWIPLLLLIPLVSRDLAADLAYHSFLASSGGLGPHSDALYRLEDALAALPPGTPLAAMDWGFAPQLRYLSSETLAPAELFGYSRNPDPDFPARTAALLAQPGAVFIFHWPQETIFPRRAAFDALLAERGLRAEALQDVARRDGAPVFQLVRAMGDR